MKKNLAKLTLHRETLNGLEAKDLHPAVGGNTQNTCFQTCNCKSAYTCYWSECGCPTSWC